jgi:hypothetical protein
VLHSAVLYLTPGAASKRRATSLVAQDDRQLAWLVHERQMPSYEPSFARYLSQTAQLWLCLRFQKLLLKLVSAANKP